MIKATVIQDSITRFGKRITTFELEYPRFIHAELMTHRVFSRNAASSRAIPVEKMHEHILKDPATPFVWQRNQAGMQSSVDLEGVELEIAKREWQIAVTGSIEYSKSLMRAGLHKQWANRCTEFAQTMKTVVTSTEWDNWYDLRNHRDAQPEIHELARVMLEVSDASYPMPINTGEWHVPYVTRARVYLNGPISYYSSTEADFGEEITLESALKVSASCCAQVSYRKNDNSIEKAEMIFDRLINSVPRHASPVEHQATPMLQPSAIFNISRPDTWEHGITHTNRQCEFGSGNFYGYIQHRQLL
jgi:thymidylate synthase ThyX